MKIGLVAAEMDPSRGRGGGIAAYTREIAAALARQGHEVHLFTRPASRWERPRGVVMHAVAEAPRGPGPELGWARALRDELLRLHAAGLELDVLEGPDFAAPLYFLLRSKIAEPRSFPVPVVVRLHGLGREMRAYGHDAAASAGFRALDRAEAFSVRAAQGRLAASRFIRKQACRRLALPESRVAVVPYPLAAEARAKPARRDPGRLVYAGRLEPRKGVDLLVKAALPWLSRRPDLTIRLIGSDTFTHRGGSMLAHLRALIPAGHRRRFEFVGPRGRAEVRKELRGCAAAVAPSRFDNLPYACLEALSTGTPLIASRTCGLPDVVEHGRSAILSDPDRASLSRALGALLSMTSRERSALGLRGRERLTRFCEPARVAKRQAAYYRRIILRPQPAAPGLSVAAPADRAPRIAIDRRKASIALSVWRRALRRVYDAPRAVS